MTNGESERGPILEKIGGNRVRVIIMGEVSSKSNSRKLVSFGNRLAPIKSDKSRAWIRSAERQIPISPKDDLLTGDLRLTMRLYYASQRPDLDPSLVLDFLQGRVYKNDRQVREMHLFHAIDKIRPRVVGIIEPI